MMSYFLAMFFLTSKTQARYKLQNLHLQTELSWTDPPQDLRKSNHVKAWWAGSSSRGPPGSSLGFLTDQNQQDSFSTCSTAGHAAVRDEVLTGHGPGNGSSGVQRGCLIFAIKYQDAFTKWFQLAKYKWILDWICISAHGRGLVFTWQAYCLLLTTAQLLVASCFVCKGTGHLKPKERGWTLWGLELLCFEAVVSCTRWAAWTVQCC